MRRVADRARVTAPRFGAGTRRPLARHESGRRMTPAQLVRHLRTANAIAKNALAAGHHPFGALLIGPDDETVLLEQGNVDGVNHA